jgi:hypothetical protein
MPAAATAVAHGFNKNNRASGNTGQPRAGGSVDDWDLAILLREERERKVNKQWDAFIQNLSIEQKTEIMEGHDKSEQAVNKRQMKSEKDKNIAAVSAIHGNLLSLLTKYIDTKEFPIGDTNTFPVFNSAHVFCTTYIGDSQYQAFKLATFTTKEGPDKYQAHLKLSHETGETNIVFGITINTTLPWLLIAQNKSEPDILLQQTFKSLAQQWIPIVTMLTNQTAWTHTFVVGTTESNTKTLYDISGSSSRLTFRNRVVKIKPASTDDRFIVELDSKTDEVPFTDLDTRIKEIYSMKMPSMPWGGQYNEQTQRLNQLID